MKASIFYRDLYIGKYLDLELLPCSAEICVYTLRFFENFVDIILLRLFSFQVLFCIDCSALFFNNLV